MNTINVPTQPLVEHLIELAKEQGNFDGEVSITTENGVEKEVMYDLDDVNWRHQYSDDDSFELSGSVVGDYTVKTADAQLNPPEKSHPAEYEHRQVQLGVVVFCNMDNNNPLEVGRVSVDMEVE